MDLTENQSNNEAIIIDTNTASSKRKSYSASYKKKILEEIDVNGNMRVICEKYGLNYQMVAKWKRDNQKYDFIDTGSIKKRREGAGRKPIIEDLEETIFDWICNRRAQNFAVSRNSIKKFTSSLVLENNILNFKCSEHWLSSFMERFDLSLRKPSTLFRLTDDEVVTRVCAYKRFMDKIDWSQYDLRNCIAIDETAVYFGDCNRTTVELRGASSVPIQATGYESERVTCILGFRLNRDKLPPTIIIKGPTKKIEEKHGVWLIQSEKAWSTQEVLKKYIERALPLITRKSQRAFIVWDVASTHRSKHMKQYLAQRRIDQAMIPSGTTMYLQSLDIAINKPFKDFVREEINDYTENRLERNQRGNLKKPSVPEVCGWVARAWSKISPDIIFNSIKASYLGPSKDFSQTYIYQHEHFGPKVHEMLQESL